MHLKIYLLIFHFVFRSAESLSGSGVRRAEDNDFPFVVSIGYRPYARDEFDPDKIMQTLHFCTGSLITTRHVLTAAHCIQGKAMSDLRVLVGSVDLRKTHPYFVRSWKSYDMWADENNKPKDIPDNDIAILELTRVVNEANVVPGRLTTNNRFELIGADSIVVGWGVNTDNIANIARYQAKVDMKVLSPTECSESVVRAGGQYFLPENEYCTKADPPAHLECGDSGGPLINNGMIIGVSDSTCPEEDPVLQYHVNLYMDVTYYRNFIYDIIGH